jgi:hypothetical protein
MHIGRKKVMHLRRSSLLSSLVDPLELFIVVTSLCLVLGCASNPIDKHPNSEDLMADYGADVNSTSVDIIFERGHNSHRILLTHQNAGPELVFFHDKQIFKSVKIDENQFKNVLTQSIETAGTLFRKPATKEHSPCRTPFVIMLKNTQKSLEVEGCRASDDGNILGKLIAQIEYLASINTFH